MYIPRFSISIHIQKHASPRFTFTKDHMLNTKDHMQNWDHFAYNSLKLVSSTSSHGFCTRPANKKNYWSWLLKTIEYVLLTYTYIKVPLKIPAIYPFQGVRVVDICNIWTLKKIQKEKHREGNSMVILNIGMIFLWEKSTVSIPLEFG